MAPGVQEVDVTADISKGQSPRRAQVGGIDTRMFGFYGFFSVFGCVMDCSFVAGVFECCFGGSGG